MFLNIINRLQQQLRRPVSPSLWLAEIDGLRFVAILPVVLQHLLERFAKNTTLPLEQPLLDNPFAFFISRGTVGVFLFFAISGFVLALPFARQYTQDGPKIELRSFFLRRLTRIEPPYVIWISVFAIVLIVKGMYGFGEMFPHWLASLTYTHNLMYGTHSVINPVAWSLEVEIQFYLLTPLLAYLYFGIAAKQKRRIGLVLFLAAWMLLQSQMGWWFFPLKLSLAGQLQHFLLGFLLADYYLNDWSVKRSTAWYWDLLAPLAFVTMCYSWTTELWKNYLFAIALFVLFAAAFKGVLFGKFLRTPWVAIIGGMCYTIYLIHLPLLEAITPFSAKLVLGNSLAANFSLQIMCTLPIILLISIIAYLIIEQPFMKNRNATTRSFPRFQKLLAMRTKITILLICIGATFSLQAQQDSTGNRQHKLELRPLNVLQAQAIANAPAIKANLIDARKQTLATQVQRRSWADALTMGGSMLYGNGSIYDTNSDATGSSYVLTDRKNVGGNVSVGIRLTGGDLVTRRPKTEIQRLQTERIDLERQELENMIRAEVTTRYCHLETAVKMLAIRSEAVENLRITLTITEKFFKEGNASVDDYTSLLSKMTTAQAQLLEAESDAKSQTLLLQELVGADIWKS